MLTVIAAIALQESSLGQLRGIQHKDRFGNPISECPLLLLLYIPYLSIETSLANKA